MVNWTSVGIVRFGTEEFVETGKIVRAFWLRLFIFLPNLLLVLVASRFWFPLLADWLKLSTETFWLVILHFATSALWIHVQFSLQAVKMPRLQGKLLTVERVLVFISLAVLAITNRLDAFSVMICYITAPLIMSLIGGWILRNFVLARFFLDWIFWRKFLVFSLPLIPFTITTYLSSGYVDAAFISKFLSTQELGIYSVATQLNGVALQLPTLINSLLLPLFVTLHKESETQKMVQYFKHLLPTLTLFWGLFSTTVSFAAYFALPIIFGEEFVATTKPFLILFANSTLIFRC